MIRSIEIKNLRGIKEGKLEDFTPLTILVGPNGCGKSTVLDALLISGSPNPGQAVGQTVQRHSGMQLGARWLIWRSEAEVSEITVTSSTGITRNCTLALSPGNPATAPALSISIYDRLALGTSTLSTAVLFNPGSAFQFTPVDCPLDGVSGTHLLDCGKEMEQVALAEVYGKAIEKGQRQQVRGILSDVVPGLLDITLLTELGQPLLYLEYKDHALPVAVAGEGIQTLLRLCLELASRPDGVVLLEEPEVHLHPGAILQSARAILAAVRRGIQVFISTHSLELIDTLLAETNDEAEREKISVFGLKLDGGCLKSYRLSGPQASLMRTQIEDDLR